MLSNIYVCGYCLRCSYLLPIACGAAHAQRRLALNCRAARYPQHRRRRRPPNRRTRRPVFAVKLSHPVFRPIPLIPHYLHRALSLRSISRNSLHSIKSWEKVARRGRGSSRVSHRSSSLRPRVYLRSCLSAKSHTRCKSLITTTLESNRLILNGLQDPTPRLSGLQ